MAKKVKVSLVSVLVISVLLTQTSFCSPQDTPDKPALAQLRNKRNVNGQQQQQQEVTTPGGGELTNIIRHLSSTENMFSNFDLMQYTPSTPSPENVNCYVEVPVTRRVGGRCVSLGSNAMGCQAGVYLALSSECMMQSNPAGGPGRFFSRAGRHFSRRRSVPLQ